jgi:hypothetical protein
MNTTTTKILMSRIDKPTSAWASYRDEHGELVRLPYVDYIVPEMYAGKEITRAIGVLCSGDTLGVVQGSLTPTASLELSHDGAYWICTRLNS